MPSASALFENQLCFCRSVATGPQGLRPVATGFEHYWSQMLLVYPYWSQSYWFCPTGPRTTGLDLLVPVATGFIWELSNKPVELEPDETRRDIFHLRHTLDVVVTILTLLTQLRGMYQNPIEPATTICISD